MNLTKLLQNFSIVTLLSIGLVSCTSSKKIMKGSEKAKTSLEELKSSLDFSNFFGIEGEVEIKATNTSKNYLDLSELTLFIEQASNNNYKSYSLKDLKIEDNLDAFEVLKLNLLLKSRIENDFKGTIDKYNVSIAFRSEEPMKNGDERNIYYIKYTYKGK